MKFKKGVFYIQLNESYNFSMMKKSGWISEDNLYGFYQADGAWVATDIFSGTSICGGKTRKSCVEFITLFQSRIDAAKNTLEYSRFAEMFQEEILNIKENENASR